MRVQNTAIWIPERIGETFTLSSPNLRMSPNCVAVKEISLSYHIGETLLFFNIYPL